MALATTFCCSASFFLRDKLIDFRVEVDVLDGEGDNGNAVGFEWRFLLQYLLPLFISADVYLVIDCLDHGFCFVGLAYSL